MKYIIILGAFQAFVALVLFWASRFKRTAGNLLNGLLICILIHLLLKFIIYAVWENQVAKVSFVTFIDLAYTPLLWMYANKINNQQYQPRKQWYLLLPAALASIAYIIIAIYLVTNHRSAQAIVNTYNTITTYLVVASDLILGAMAFRLTKSMSAFWDMEQKLIKKIALMYFFMGVAAALLLIGEKTQLIPAGQLNIPFRIVAYSLLLCQTLMIIQYRVVSQAQLKMTAPAAVELSPEQPDRAEEIRAGTTRRSTLTTGQQQSIAGKLEALMQNRDIFTDPELSLEKLASLSGIPRNQISETLNQCIGKSFYHYINEYRIKEVIHLLDKSKQQKQSSGILSLAFDAGFNSKTTFNQYFKKVTGLTPSEYLKSNTKTDDDQLFRSKADLNRNSLTV